MRLLWRKGAPNPGPAHDQFSATLPSRVAGLDFTSNFWVSWTPIVGIARQRHPHSAACDLVLYVARQALTAAPCSIKDLVEAEHRVNAALGRLNTGEHPEIRILAARATLSVPHDIRALADEYDRLEREQRLADFAQAGELDRLNRFRESVLRDPGTVLAYQYMKDPGQDLKTLLDSPLEELIKRVGDYDPTKGWIQVAKLLTSIVSELDKDHIEHLVWVLCEIVGRAGHPEKRNAIRHYLMEEE
ncbi:hypothetical protein AB0H63_25595 [Micromonospora echinospora]|uniref:hypothetical protein n=1 Tax=Micromonospora echinospora TaxID=1877 RepID=UPI0034062EF4